MKSKGLGGRAVKTAVAVFICISLYILLVLILKAFGVTTNALTSDNSNFNSSVVLTGWRAAFKLATETYTPFFACIATAYSMSSSKGASIKQAQLRIVASLIGGLFGVLCVFLYQAITNTGWAFQYISATGNATGGVDADTSYEYYSVVNGFFENGDLTAKYVLNYIAPIIITGLATLVVIWICKLVGRPDATFAAVLTLTAVMTSLGTNPIIYGFNRIFSTIVGVLVALGVNMFRLPRRTKNKDILFAIGIEGVVRADDGKITGYMNYKLNDMVDKGANVTLFTTRIPRTFMHLFGHVKINHPVVCMSGAALYDFKKLTYLAIETIPYEISLELDKKFKELDISPFKNYIIDDCLTVYNEKIDNLGYRLMADKMKNGGYGNFFIGKCPEEGLDVLFYLMIENRSKLPKIKAAFESGELANQIVLQTYDYFDENSKVVPELVYIKIYSRKILELNVLKKYAAENNLRICGLTTNLMANHLLDNAEIKVTAADYEGDNIIRIESYEDMFRHISKIYYSKEFSGKEEK